MLAENTNPAVYITLIRSRPVSLSKYSCTSSGVTTIYIKVGCKYILSSHLQLVYN